MGFNFVLSQIYNHMLCYVVIGDMLRGSGYTSTLLKSMNNTFE